MGSSLSGLMCSTRIEAVGRTVMKEYVYTYVFLTDHLLQSSSTNLHKTKFPTKLLRRLVCQIFAHAITTGPRQSYHKTFRRLIPTVHPRGFLRNPSSSGALNLGLSLPAAEKRKRTYRQFRVLENKLKTPEDRGNDDL